MSEASQSPSPSPPGHLQAATQQTTTSKSDPDAALLSATVPAASDLKHEPAQHAQQDSPAAQSRQAEAEHALLRSDDVSEMAGDIGMATEGEEGQGSDGEGSTQAEGQRLTRSRRGNAAGLFMLDHGSQLIPKKVALELTHLTTRQSMHVALSPA